MLFVFLKEAMVFQTSFSSKFEFRILLLFRTNKHKLITEPNKEAHRAHKAWSASRRHRRMPLVVGFPSPSGGVFSRAWAWGAQGAKRGMLFETKTTSGVRYDGKGFKIHKFVAWIVSIPKSSNSRSKSASWSLSPCSLPLLAKAMDGGICKRRSDCPNRPLTAAAAWAWAWTCNCWQVAYILKVVAIKNTPSTSHSCT